jgi:hypothetical protein
MSDTDRILTALEAMRSELPELADNDELRQIAELLAQEEADLADLRLMVRTGALLGAPTDPAHPNWEPYGAIAELHAQGNIEEATWLAFVSTHIGPREGDADGFWRAPRMVYSGFGDGVLSWARVSADPEFLIAWGARHADQLEHVQFGNHRKFQSPKHLPDVLKSYVAGVHHRADGTQQALLERQNLAAAANFDRLMREMEFIYQFGRLGIYDLLSLLGNLGIYNLEAGRLYLRGATGPHTGARLLLGSSLNIDALDDRCCELATRLGVAIDAMESALCNWQKHL